MKKLILVFVTLPFLFSCENNTLGGHKFNLRVCSGSGLLYTETWLECDSFQMISSTQASVWVDGTKMNVIGERGIKPETN